MRFLFTLLFGILVTLISSWFLPWWGTAIILTLYITIFISGATKSVLTGALCWSIAWLILTWYQLENGGEIIYNYIAEILTLPTGLLFWVPSILGLLFGLGAGFTAHSLSSFRTPKHRNRYT